ncbi:MAG: class I SAM-dependent methyltransferase [Beijerinckiaceae bacterium]
MNAAVPPLLFDHALLAARARQRPPFLAGADFLIRHAAEDVAERLAPVLRPFPRILDLATPTDAFSEAVSLLRPEATVTRITTPVLPCIGTTVLDPEREPMPEAAFDLVVSGLSLQHANDLPGMLAQGRRALAPDGLFLACMAGGATLTELRQALTEAETEVAGGVSPRVFPFADVRDMGGLLQRAGFALPVADSDVVTVRYDHLFALMADLRAMAAGNVLMARLRKPTLRRVFHRAAEIYATRFADADGRIRASFELIWLSGWAPHESQQRPLKPGSAKQRLADALGVGEQPLALRGSPLTRTTG